MINEKMQNDAWRSLSNNFKSELKKVYNRACYSMAALKCQQYVRLVIWDREFNRR